MNGAVEALGAAEWRGRAAAHEARIDAEIAEYLVRRSQGEKQPVLDFLFEYYSLGPAQLRRWLPGMHQRVRGEGAEGFLEAGPYRRWEDGSVGLDPAAFPEQRRRGLEWVIELLAATAGRDPAYICYGLHEWAMLYQAREPRHSLPLRLGREGTNAVVEQHQIRCTHYDAFRFFTPAAQPRNQLELSNENRSAHEQPGCLHANMDIYRWAYKFHPWLGSDLVGDCFVLACRVRELDMAASPYDLRGRGLEPICIERPEGKREYVRRQKLLAEEAGPLRRRLLERCRELLAAIGG